MRRKTRLQILRQDHSPRCRGLLLFVVMSVFIGAILNLRGLNRAFAVEDAASEYLPGFATPAAGYQPDPGIYFAYDFNYYTGNAQGSAPIDAVIDGSLALDPSGFLESRLADRDSEIQLPGLHRATLRRIIRQVQLDAIKQFLTSPATVPFSLSASGAASIKVRLNQFAYVLTLSPVTKLKILGGNYQFAISMPLVYAALKINADLDVNLSAKLAKGGKLQADRRVRVSRIIRGSNTGIGDLIVTPAILGWHRGRLHWKLYMPVYIPTGEYDIDNLVNLGHNRWAIEPSAAVTWLDTKKGRELTLVAGYTINFMNYKTDYNSGNELHIEYRIAQYLPWSGLSVGFGGYYLQQLTSDSGSATNSFRGRVFGMGPQITYSPKIFNHTLYFSVRYYNEFQTKNRFDGNSLFASVSTKI